MDGFAVLVNGLGLMSLIAALFGVMIRARVGVPLRDLALGAVFGLFAGLPGVLPAMQGVDPQIMLIGFAAAFLGLGGLAVALAFALVLHAMPGWTLAASQVAALLSAAGAGLLWSIVVPAGWQERIAGHAFLGLLVTVATAMPVQSAAAAAPGAAAGAMILGIFLALAMGTMVARERAQLRREAALESEARTDPLTGLANRRALVERHAAALDAWPAPGVAVAIIDLDRFKAVNDTHGHDAGDAVLVAAARRLQAVCLRPEWSGRAFPARLGGEEFAVHLAATSRREALGMAEALRAALEAEPVPLPSGAPLRVTGSIGIACTDTPLDLLALLGPADVALYAAKNGGRNCVRLAGALPSPEPVRRAAAPIRATA